MALVIDTTFNKAPGSNHTTPTATPTCKRPTPLIGRWGDYAWDNFMDAAQSGARPQDPHEAFQRREGSTQGSPLSATRAADASSFVQANEALDSTQPGLSSAAPTRDDSMIALRDPTAPPRQSSTTDSYASFKSAGSPNNSFAPPAAQAQTRGAAAPSATVPLSGALSQAVGSMVRQDTGDSEGGFLCDPTQFVDFAAMGQGQGVACVCLPPARASSNVADGSAPGRNSHQPYLQPPPAQQKKQTVAPAPAVTGWPPEQQQQQVYPAYHQPQWGHPSSSAYPPHGQPTYPAPAAHYQPGDRNRALGQQRPVSPPAAQQPYPPAAYMQQRMAFEAGGYPSPNAHPFAPAVALSSQGAYPLAPHMVYPPALQQVSQHAQSYPGPADPRNRGSPAPPASHHVPNSSPNPGTSLAAGATSASQYSQRIFHSASLPLQISRFPPPPPPSMRAISILTVGGAAEKQAQNIALRWYKRVVASQPAHPRVPPCPEPDFALTPVEAWVNTIGEWWKVNYSGMTTSAVFGPPSISPPGSHTKRRGNTGGSNSGSANNRSFGTGTGTSSQPNSANNRVGGGTGSNRGSANNRTGSQPNSANNRLRQGQGGDSFEVTAL